MRLLHNFFNRAHRPSDDIHTLSIDGIPAAPMTAKADEAEIAAETLLDGMIRLGRKKAGGRVKHSHSGDIRDAAYHQQLSERMRAVRAAETIGVLRFLAYAEEKLLRSREEDALTEIERGLYDRMDIVDRDGGDLKKRWQHALAEVTVRLMQHRTKLTIGNS